MNYEDKLKKLCEEYGFQLEEKPNGHFQIKGKLLVNYYPYSKNKTAYIAQTAGGFKYVTPEVAVEMAANLPPLSEGKTERKRSYREDKDKLYRKRPYCNWCNKQLTRKESTLDHIVPLSRGGLNHHNNYVLACKECNQQRDNKMSELWQSS